MQKKQLLRSRPESGAVKTRMRVKCGCVLQGDESIVTLEVGLPATAMMEVGCSVMALKTWDGMVGAV